MIITIDGPAGSGKSTVARCLAERLGVRFLDTGAMYRAIALLVIRSGKSLTDAAAVAQIAQSAHIRFRGNQLLLNECDVTSEIRAPEVSSGASLVAAIPEVRYQLVRLQQEIGREGSMVTEGRDQGTVVFPNAQHKYFLTASLDARANRRLHELSCKGIPGSLEEVREQIRLRDERDEHRELAPMKPAPDAVLVDTSHLPVEDVIQLLMRQIQA
jgi:cytidylate kinase